MSCRHGGERILVGPELAHDLDARVAAVGVDSEQPAAGSERARERGDHFGRFEPGRRAGAVGLRCDHQVVAGARLPLARNDFVQQEAEVLAIDHQRHRALVDRVAALEAVPRLPVPGEEGLERRDLLAEFVPGGAGQGRFVPDQRGRRRERLGREPGRLVVVQVGDHQHGRRVLVEAVRHLVERQPHVLEAHLLADEVERQRREAGVQLAHHARERRAIAHAGVEHAHRRRAGVDVRELQADAARDHALLAAGVDEQQIFLPVVEEAEVARRRGLGGWRACRRGRDADQAAQLRRGGGGGGPVVAHEHADALEGLGRDTRAGAQAGDELAVVHRAAAEGGFRDPVVAAELRDAVEQRAAGFRHGFHTTSSSSRTLAPRRVGRQPPFNLRLEWEISHCVKSMC